MRKTPTLATGVAIAAGGLMAAALVTPTLSASADGDGAPPPGLERTASAQKALTGFSCSGGSTKASRNLGIYDGFFDIPAGTTKSLPGKMTFKGPKKGKDTVSVAVTGFGYLYGAYQLGAVTVTVDGNPLKPGTLATPAYWMGSGDSSGYTSGAAQFCGKVGKGRHTVRVKFTNTSGASSWGLYSATAHAELNN
ncbi:hypothetical protein [Solicola gregarius]|uniref:Uncharacterized protein n=1 Tax=Solicola gregarius TaxID=2908642 RepID=A0AA46TGU2_9ACTN|nr:hypothetical protein [Solicola gregarius]UYM05071.1 hypothetical protein L0C25_21530 [Solicola gregarius]